MGKLLLSLHLFLLFPALLFGSVWSSNAIGQKLFEKEVQDNKGWERVDGDGVSTLYFNGEVENVRTEYPDGYEEKGREESIRYFFGENGELIRKIIKRDSGIEEYNYYYTGSLLSSFSRSIDSVVVENNEYIRTPDGVVLAIKKNGNPMYFSESAIYEMVEGTLETFLMEEEEEKSEKIWNEDGGYSEEKKEDGVIVTYIYDGNGRLIEKKRELSVVTYSYDEDGSLKETIEENTEGRIKTEYIDGKVSSIYSYDSSLAIKSVRKPLPDGTFEETRYIDGVPRYIFHFDRDGERILEAIGL